MTFVVVAIYLFIFPENSNVNRESNASAEITSKPSEVQKEKPVATPPAASVSTTDDKTDVAPVQKTLEKEVPPPSEPAQTDDANKESINGASQNSVKETEDMPSKPLEEVVAPQDETDQVNNAEKEADKVEVEQKEPEVSDSKETLAEEEVKVKGDESSVIQQEDKAPDDGGVAEIPKTEEKVKVSGSPPNSLHSSGEESEQESGGGGGGGLELDFDSRLEEFAQRAFGTSVLEDENKRRGRTGSRNSQEAETGEEKEKGETDVGREDAVEEDDKAKKKKPSEGKKKSPKLEQKEEENSSKGKVTGEEKNDGDKEEDEEEDEEEERLGEDWWDKARSLLQMTEEFRKLEPDYGEIPNEKGSNLEKEDGEADKEVKTAPEESTKKTAVEGDILKEEDMEIGDEDEEKK